MLRSILVALIVAGCSQPAPTSPGTENVPALAYPADPLPPEVAAQLGSGPDPDNYDAVMQLLESAEPEMVRLRRPMTPIIVKVDNLAEDGIVWTILSFNGAMGEDHVGRWFDGRWVARRARKTWDGQTLVDWADSDGCSGFLSALSGMTALEPPNIAEPQHTSRRDGAKLTLVPERQFTLWTTWAPSYDLRFSGNAETQVGQWAIGLAIALQPCWTNVEPELR